MLRIEWSFPLVLEAPNAYSRLPGCVMAVVPTAIESCTGLLRWQRVLKRTFDVVVAASLLLTFGWMIPVAALGARISTGRPGLFRQVRVGKDGRPFDVLKLRTMRDDGESTTTVTTSDDTRITAFGVFLRRTKLDELPQLYNVLVGDMSLVGPRPDVAGWADRLAGADRVLLAVRPGVTGPATLVFRNEEATLAAQDDPERYNREVIWPTKVRINRRYVERWRLRDDLRYLWLTARGRALNVHEALR